MSIIVDSKLWAEVTKYKIIVMNYELVKGNDVIFIDGDIIINEPFVKDLYNNIGDNDSVSKEEICKFFGIVDFWSFSIIMNYPSKCI